MIIEFILTLRVLASSDSPGGTGELSREAIGEDDNAAWFLSKALEIEQVDLPRVTNLDAKDALNPGGRWLNGGTLGDEVVLRHTGSFEAWIKNRSRIALASACF